MSRGISRFGPARGAQEVDNFWAGSNAGGGARITLRLTTAKTRRNTAKPERTRKPG